MIPRRFIAVSIFLALIAACGAISYDSVGAGRFKGTVVVAWVDDGSESLGDGRFVYIPTDFTFDTRLSNGNPITLTPGMIYTDGGSIPKAAQLFRGFSPWGYAPAYIVHDWLFVARRCVLDNQATSNEMIVKDLEFEDSSWIIASAIKTLISTKRVRPNDVAPRVITGAVGSPVTAARWNATGECLAKDRVPQKLQDEIRKALAAAQSPRTLRRTTPPPGFKFEVLSTVQF